jgi:hypothetical protein
MTWRNEVPKEAAAAAVVTIFHSNLVGDVIGLRVEGGLSQEARSVYSR